MNLDDLQVVLLVAVPVVGLVIASGYRVWAGRRRVSGVEEVITDEMLEQLTRQIDVSVSKDG